MAESEIGKTIIRLVETVDQAAMDLAQALQGIGQGVDQIKSIVKKYKKPSNPDDDGTPC
jgi:hypothetical protein